MWGSVRDDNLLKYVAKKFPTISDLQENGRVIVHEGFQLRGKDSSEAVERVDDLVGKKTINVERLRSRGRLFAFPSIAIEEIPSGKPYIRIRGGKGPLAVCHPPHIILDATRRYAVYSDEYLVVPPRQIGIAGEPAQSGFLKALTLYLSSKFALYHQFFVSPEWGVKIDRSTLRALKQLPVAIAELSSAHLTPWVKLHDRLVNVWPTDRTRTPAPPLSLFGEDGEQSEDTHADVAEADALYARLNEMVYECIGISESDRYLIEDLVDVKMQLVDGKVSKDAMRRPHKPEIEAYLAVLQSELDTFVGEEEGLRHHCTAVHDSISGMVVVELKPAVKKPKPCILEANAATAREMETTRKELRREYGQWLYFDRNLRIYKGERTYVLKPFQRVHWLRSQALIDADEIIAETIAATGD
jgi:hypothetical protein